MPKLSISRSSRSAAEADKHARIDAFVRNAGEHVIANPDLFRGVDLTKLLQRRGYWFRKSPSKLVMSQEQSENLFAQTSRTTRFWQFLSHSWHAPGVLKALSMLSFYNVVPAHISGVVAAGICLALSITGVLPAWNSSASARALEYMMQNPNCFHDDVPIAGWCILSYEIAYVFVLMFYRPMCNVLASMGQYFRIRKSGSKIIFLDRLSIHQGNPKMKLEGIQSLGYFLANSQEYVVIWDETFFERVWCVFEFAVYNSVQPKGTIVIVPMLLYCLEIVMSLVCTTFWLSWSIFVAFGWPQAIIEFLSDAGTPKRLVLPMIFFAAYPFAIAYGLFARIYHRSRLKIRQQMQTFRVDRAECCHQSDREQVVTAINRLYGSVISFEAFVRGHCCSIMQQAALGFKQLPWWMNFSSMSLPNFIGLAFDNWVALDKSTSSCKAHWLAGAAITSFLHWPLFYYVFESCFTVMLFTPNKRTESAVLVVEGFVASLVVSIWASTWEWVFAESLYWKAMSVIGGIALCLYAWRGQSGDPNYNIDWEDFFSQHMSSLTSGSEESVCYGSQSSSKASNSNVSQAESECHSEEDDDDHVVIEEASCSKLPSTEPAKLGMQWNTIA